MGEPVREVAVVGEKQQSLGVLVEAADREHPRLGGHEVGDAATSVRVAGRRDDAGRLVQQVVDQAGARADRDAVDLDAIDGRIDLVAERRHAVR